MKIAFASGKGGTGKTTLTTNLASLIAETREVLVADLDAEEPNSGLFINGRLINSEINYKLIPQWNSETCNNCGKCSEYCNFNAIVQYGNKIIVMPELCHSCHMCSELCPTNSLPLRKKRIGTTSEYAADNIIFVESRLDIGEEQAVPQIAQTIEYINKKYVHIQMQLIDSPPGTSCPMIETVKSSDYVILVTEPTPFGLNDLALAVETLRIINKRFAVVINRYGIGNENVENYCFKNNIEIIAKIPNDRKVAELYSEGKMIFTQIPEFRNELEKIKNFIFNMNVRKPICGKLW